MAYGDNDTQLVAIANGAPNPDGTVQQIYAYSTDDTATAVETDGYFDGAVSNGLAKGDIIMAALDLDGTPAKKDYMVTVGGADVTVVAEVDADT